MLMLIILFCLWVASVVISWIIESKCEARGHLSKLNFPAIFFWVGFLVLFIYSVSWLARLLL